MKSKKFVLAALVLLAITGLLALTSCKNDSVPETPAAKLVSISVIPPEGTVYKVGDEVVHKKDGEIGVTAHYDNGTTRPVTGTITTDTSTLTKSAGVQTVTVRYSEGGIEVTGQFEIRVLPTILTEGNWTYVEFGEWPQTIKDANVTVYESEGKGKEMGMFTCYLGSDDNYYVKAKEKAAGDDYKYSNGEQAGGTSTKWFKVEPIVWRVLTTSYKAPEGGTAGNALLLAEKILTGGVPYYDVWYTDRTVGVATIHPNNYEHSAVRAWLNGLEYEYKGSDGDEQIEKEDYFGKGFLQTAFTESARKLIADTSVDNSAASTFGVGEPTRDNPYASDTPTKDKVFLLSEEEATTLNSGFDEYSDSGEDSTQIRVTTDYAKATGAYQSTESGYGCWCWLRSPYYIRESSARVIYYYGYADRSDYGVDTLGGVVPALSISLQ